MLTSRFFTPPSTVPQHNISTFASLTLDDFCTKFASFPVILAYAQQNGFFKKIKSMDYGIKNFLESTFSYIQPHLQTSAVQFLEKPLVKLSEPMPELTELPTDYHSLIPKLQLYLNTIQEVFSNKLAERAYDAVDVNDAENVSERDHGLQAWKISHLLGLSRADSIAMGLHDIARATHPSVAYGNLHHHIEADIILEPLGVTRYAYYHGYAKYLLSRHCSNYMQTLISPVSEDSLKTQEKSLQSIIKSLEQIGDAPTLAKAIYKLMLLRLIDDLSKTPNAILTNKTPYFSDQMIKYELHKQIISYLSENSILLQYYEKQLDNALALLSRAKEYTNNPEQNKNKEFRL